MIGAVLNRIRTGGSWLWKHEASLRGARFSGRATFVGRPILSVAPGSTMRLGDNLHCNSSPRSNPLGCFQPCVLRTMSSGAVIDLGPNVGLSAAVLVAGQSIVVGEGTIFGAGAVVIDNDFHFPEGQWGWGFDCVTTAKPVVIGRGCFIGARAWILKGVTLGDRVVVGAGSVVTRDVPAGWIAVGNPAKLFPPNTSESLVKNL